MTSSMTSFMRKTVRIIIALAFAAAAAIPAHSFNLTVGVSRALLDAVAAHRTNSTALSRADYVISKVDSGIVKAFERAWQRSALGTSSLEGVVLILRMADGSFSGKDMGSSNEYKSFTFPWHPAAIAIVHTHPNTSDPQPCDADLVAADKHNVPIFTITRRGMFVYDPVTRKISKVMNNLDWLDPSRWSKTIIGKTQVP